MPTISNLYSTFARQGFAKSFTHGYAQSVVAVTHPASYPNQHNRTAFTRRPSRLGKLNNYQFQNAFHNNAAAASSAAVQEGRVERAINNHAGLDAYFDAWKDHHAAGVPEEEWTQFQFAKRIEWKTPAPAVAELVEDNVVAPIPSRAAIDRSYSSSAVDDLRHVEAKVAEALDQEEHAKFLAAEEAALAEIDAKIQRAIEDRAALEASPRVPSPPLAPVQSPALTPASFLRSPATSATSISTIDPQSEKFAKHLTDLAEAGRYNEIPAVFQSMLAVDIQPLPQAYGALLASAINFSKDPMQTVPKALDVYSDMLRRKVAPNTEIYSTLLALVSSRSIEISTLKKTLEEKRIRFGGMEEAGKFMLASSELEFDILSEDDRLVFALQIFETSVMKSNRAYSAETYHALIAACAEAARVPDMLRIYSHMETKRVVPLAATFMSLIKGFTKSKDLSSAVECYNEYKSLAVANDNGLVNLSDRQDAAVYAAVVKSYVDSNKLAGAEKFFNKIVESSGDASLRDVIISRGLVQGLIDSGSFSDAFSWAERIENSSAKSLFMSKIATSAADRGHVSIATTAFNAVNLNLTGIADLAVAMLALSVRTGDVAAATQYWQCLSSPLAKVDSSFIEPTAMYTVALMGTGQVVEGLLQAEQMFGRIRASATESIELADEVDEGVHFVQRFMAQNGIIDPRAVEPQAFHTPVPHVAQPVENSYDPYANSTDFKGSALIIDELERGSTGRMKASRLNEAMTRFRNIRRVGRHPRYITYAKLISAAAREEKMNLVNDILGMAKTDIPLLPQYSVVRYGWASILDAMVGACLTLGNRAEAARYHQELLDMGCAPTANTFGLYITTLKESTKTFDEASEAVKIFHRAKQEGVEPSSFLYNALIGKLGKARRIDDCLFYFAEMRALNVRPTSVTYGTIVNALCRVSDSAFAEELFEEMEAMPNYKARPAPYNSLMQFFLTTKRDKAKVLAYYERMKAKGIQPTNHTYKLLVDAHATLDPVNMAAAESVLDVIRASGSSPEAVHYSSLIHAKGCVLHDLPAARAVFDSVLADPSIRPQACLYQALFEAMVAGHQVGQTEELLVQMKAKRVEMTPYIANTLIHGWAGEKNIIKARDVFASVSKEKREPSTYEAMTRAYLAVEDRTSAKNVVQEMLSRGYPSAVSNKILELIGGAGGEAL